MAALLLFCLLRSSGETSLTEVPLSGAGSFLSAHAPTDDARKTPPHGTIMIVFKFSPSRYPFRIRGEWTKAKPFEVSVRIAPCVYFCVMVVVSETPIPDKESP